MFRRVVPVVTMTLLLVACAKDAKAPHPTDKAATVALHFSAAEGLNAGANGQPAPVRVRIFELKNPANFSRADYFALVDRAQRSLGVDLIDQDEVWLLPGQQLNVDRSLNVATRQVGLVVGYRDIDQAQWRVVLDIAPRMANEFQVDLDARAISSRPSALSTRPAQ